MLIWVVKTLGDRNLLYLCSVEENVLMKAAILFLKDWTLPTAIMTGAVLYFIFALVPELDGFATQVSPIFDAVLPWFLFVILFVTFCKIDFREMRPSKWHLWASVSQVLLVLGVVGCILYFDIQGPNRILLECVVTCIIVPCAAASAVVTMKLGGSLESMTAHTFLSNIVTAIMIPLIFPLLEQHMSGGFLDTFLMILGKVCMILVVPMGLACVVRHFLPRLQHWIVSIDDLGFYLWGCSLTIVSGITFRNIMNAGTTVEFLALIALVSFVLCIIQFALGRNIGHFFGATIECGQALGQKNTAFAIWVASAYLNPLSSVGPGCYILWQNLVNSLELWQHRRVEHRHAHA